MILNITLLLFLIFTDTYANQDNFSAESSYSVELKNESNRVFDNITLSQDELNKLNNNEIVLRLKDIDNKPWPEITYIIPIKATALQSIALFSAYDIQKKYIPNLIESTPIKNVSPTDVWTRYELKLPFPLKNSKYIHGAQIFKTPAFYKSQWYLVESSTTKEISGEAKFYQRTNDSILVYRSLITPKSSIASLVKNSMLKDVKLTIVTIKEFIEKTVKTDNQTTTKYSKFINDALKGRIVYEISQQ